jgi:hypothetical protein
LEEQPAVGTSSQVLNRIDRSGCICIAREGSFRQTGADTNNLGIGAYSPDLAHSRGNGSQGRSFQAVISGCQEDADPSAKAEANNRSTSLFIHLTMFYEAVYAKPHACHRLAKRAYFLPWMRKPGKSTRLRQIDKQGYDPILREKVRFFDKRGAILASSVKKHNIRRESGRTSYDQPSRSVLFRLSYFVGEINSLALPSLLNHARTHNEWRVWIEIEQSFLPLKSPASDPTIESNNSDLSPANTCPRESALSVDAKSPSLTEAQNR